MRKQDETVKNLFDDYAEELSPRDDLSGKAREAMLRQSAQRQQQQTRKRQTYRRFVWVGSTCCAVLILVLCLGVLLPMLSPSTTPDGTGNPSTPQPVTATKPTYYTFADVKGRSVSADYCDESLQISRLKQSDEYIVVSERYYAFYTEEGELRYIRALLGVRSASGAFTEIELVAEVDGYVRSDLSDTYEFCSRYSGMVSDGEYSKDGEYVTRAFFSARDMHFYVVARNGQYTDEAEKIISQIL